MNIRKIIIYSVLIISIFLGYFTFQVYTAVFSPNTKFENETQEIFIKSETSFSELLKQLSPLLKNTETFSKVAHQWDYAYKVRAGKFVISKGMNNYKIIRILRGKGTPVKVSFNNQERIENLAGRIAQQLEADSLSFLQAFTNEAFLRERDFSKENALSMYIPNTYEFYWNTSPEQFREKIHKEYLRFWTKKRLEKAEKQNLSPLEVIVLASIVQKETAKIDERPRVAGVYLNRLKIGMSLQADPTIIYAIKKETGRFDTIIRRVFYNDLKINSPYNTYLNKGLPPAPITMPDISSIDAVLSAEKHSFLYFVADVKNFGYHTFASDYQQHNKNREQYIQWVKKQNIKR